MRGDNAPDPPLTSSRRYPFCSLARQSFFLPVRGGNCRGVFCVRNIVAVIFSLSLAAIFAGLVNYDTFPCRFFGSAQRNQVRNKHKQGNTHLDHNGFPERKFLDQQASGYKPEQRHQGQYPRAADTAFTAFTCRL